MKILYISYCVPHDKIDHAGGQTLNYYLKGISERDDTNVRLITFCEAEDINILMNQKDSIKKYPIVIKHDFVDVLKNIYSVPSKFWPYHRYGNFVTKKVALIVLKMLKQFKQEGYYPDIISMEWTQISIFIRDIKKVYPNAKYVSSEVDVTYLGYRRKAENEHRMLLGLYKRLKYRNAKKCEIKALADSDMVIVQNDKDKDLIVSDGICKEKIFTIVPYYHRSSLPYKRTNNRIIFFGYMKRKENIDAVRMFCKDIMPRLDDTDCVFSVIGSGAQETVSDLASSNVEIVGYVEKIDSWFSEGMCFVAPLRLGAGIKVKCLEALYSGIPVLTNDVGIEGIPAINEVDYYHCSSPDDYIGYIKEIYSDDNKRVSGRKLVNKKFNLEKSRSDYVDAILSLSRR